MKRAMIVGGALAIVLVLLLVLATGRGGRKRDADPGVATVPALPSSTPTEASEGHQGFLYGRITTVDGTIYEGRLRWGGDEEAFWSDYFNGFKDENPWAALVPPEQLMESNPIEIFGFRIANRESQIELRRPFMARFGELARIEARGRDLRVTLKSGTVFDLDRLGADDLADGLRVWDAKRGVVDLDELRISSVELLPTRLSAAPDRLHGTVRTRQGDFTGFVQWDRKDCVGTDELDGRTADGELAVRFDTIRSIARHSRDGSMATLLDGREILLSGTPEVGQDNRGLYVDDPRYGRVLVSWDAFERVDFSSGGSGPGFEDFPSGRPIIGSVTTRAGRHLAGRLVYDLDESVTTETLDAPFQGVTYTIPFGLIASIVPGGPEEGREEGVAQPASVVLHSGEELALESAGDLGEGNAGMLIFVDGAERPEYLPWADIERIDFDRPPAMDPPLGGPWIRDHTSDPEREQKGDRHETMGQRICTCPPFRPPFRSRTTRQRREDSREGAHVLRRSAAQHMIAMRIPRTLRTRAMALQFVARGFMGHPPSAIPALAPLETWFHTSYSPNCRR